RAHPEAGYDDAGADDDPAVKVLHPRTLARCLGRAVGETTHCLRSRSKEYVAAPEGCRARAAGFARPRRSRDGLTNTCIPPIVRSGTCAMGLSAGDQQALAAAVRRLEQPSLAG